MKYFTIAELCKSDTADKQGIDNRLPKELLTNVQRLISEVLDPLREPAQGLVRKTHLHQLRLPLRGVEQGGGRRRQFVSPDGLRRRHRREQPRGEREAFRVYQREPALHRAWLGGRRAVGTRGPGAGTGRGKGGVLCVASGYGFCSCWRC